MSRRNFMLQKPCRTISIFCPHSDGHRHPEVHLLTADMKRYSFTLFVLTAMLVAGLLVFLKNVQIRPGPERQVPCAPASFAVKRSSLIKEEQLFIPSSLFF